MKRLAVCLLAYGLPLGSDQLEQLRSLGPDQLLIAHPAAGQFEQGLTCIPHDLTATDLLKPLCDAEWLLLLYPWEQTVFGREQLEAVLAELPEDLNRIGLMVKTADGQCWHWSARLLRRGTAWYTEDPGEALCDDLVLQQIPCQHLAEQAAAQILPGVLTFYQTLMGPVLDLTEQPSLTTLLAEPWTLEPALLEQLLVQAIDQAMRAWQQEAAQGLLTKALQLFPASPALQLLQSSLFSATGQLARCQELLWQLQSVESEPVWSQPVCLQQADYLTHLLALLAFWTGNDALARAQLPVSPQPPPLPAELLTLLQQSASLSAARDFASAKELLDQGIQATRALPLALQAWAQEYVSETSEFPELGSLACHHLDFITLKRLNPDRLLSRLLFARAEAEFQLHLPQQALQTLTLALANPMGSPGKVGMVLQHFVDFLALGLAGDVVELGCNQGSTSLGLQTCLKFLSYPGDHAFHVYDSFEGLPPPLPEDGLTPYVAGSCSTVRDAFVTRFQAFDVILPEIHAGWFAQTLPQELPARIGFAYLDGDFYSSIHESLTAIYPRLLSGATVLIDDYGTTLLPGVEKACADFFRDKPEQVSQIFRHGVEALGWFQKV